MSSTRPTGSDRGAGSRLLAWARAGAPFVLLFLLAGCATPRNEKLFLEDLALSGGPGVVIPGVPPLDSDRANGGISAVASLFRFWKMPPLPRASEDRLAESMDALLVPPEEVMTDLADRRMLWSYSFYATLDEVEVRLLAGVPVLALVQDRADDPSTRRYVVVVGFNREKRLLLLHERGARDRIYEYGEFKRIWRPVRNWCLVICPPDRITWPMSTGEVAERARFHERTGQWRASLADLEQLQRNAPEDIQVMMARARVHQRAGEEAVAVALYREALAIDPLSARAANNLAYLLSATEDQLAEAERWSRRALTIEPSNPHYLDTLGAILLAQRRAAEAAEVLERARHRAANLPPPSRREIEVRLMRAFVASGQGHLARQVLADVKKEDPGFQLPGDLEKALP